MYCMCCSYSKELSVWRDGEPSYWLPKCNGENLYGRVFSSYSFTLHKICTYSITAVFRAIFLDLYVGFRSCKLGCFCRCGFLLFEVLLEYAQVCPPNLFSDNCKDLRSTPSNSLVWSHIIMSTIIGLRLSLPGLSVAEDLETWVISR